MFAKVLVANRGEIAIRIMRACRELGIRSIAVYSKPDEESLFPKYADEAYLLGGGPPQESYLNIDKIVDIAKKADADAIHPGYGFLSENPEFARRCEEEDIQFIGPGPRALRRLGDKLNAKRIVKSVGISCTPGSDILRNHDEAIDCAEKIGYPVILKAAAGGGGRGMRVINSRDEMREAFDASSKIVQSAFGDPSLFLEKYFEKCRHIEVQTITDMHGDAVHLYERECSIQRKAQKIMEECPSPLVDGSKKELYGWALKIMKRAGYENAGTVEFLYSDGDFYFMEVNPRLQVEHGITEMVTGIDIVKKQIEIAAGEELGLKQKDISLNGWAMEARICAEDPVTLEPSPGKIEGYRSPGGIGVRIDSGIHMGYTVPFYYDSLVAKLAVWGRDREEAVNRLRRTLYEYIIKGIKTNLPLFRTIVGHKKFLDGELCTDFIERYKVREGAKAIIDFGKIRERSLESIFDRSIFEDGKEGAYGVPFRMLPHLKETADMPEDAVASPTVGTSASVEKVVGDSNWKSSARKENLSNG